MNIEANLSHISTLGMESIDDYKKKLFLANITSKEREILLNACDERLQRVDRNAAMVEESEIKVGEI